MRNSLGTIALLLLEAVALLSPPGRSLGQPPQTIPQPSLPGRTPPRQLTTIVLDPAHGGTDAGVHQLGGVIEKDLVLTLANLIRMRLEQQGYRVVMTRQADLSLSFDDRAALANSRHNALFLSLHIGSTGPTDSAFAFYFDCHRVVASPPAPTGLVPWDEAQCSWLPLSQRLAELLQVELARTLPDSPELPTPAEVYQLRLIAEPAVAIEIPAPTTIRPEQILAHGDALADAIARAVQAFRSYYQSVPAS